MIRHFYRLSAVFFIIFVVGTVNAYSGADNNNCGYIVNVTDIHFDPFYDSSIVPELIESDIKKWDSIFKKSNEKSYGSFSADSNYELFVSALESIKEVAPHPDFIIYTGDFICHNFNSQFSSFNETKSDSSSDDTSKSNEKLHKFIYKTVKFVLMKLAETYPGIPIYSALGNDDSYIGDYQIRFDGEFLKDTSKLFKEKVFFSDLFQANEYDTTYDFGGFYRAGIPNIENAEIIALNSIFYTENYEYNGESDLHPGFRELDWLAQKLENAKINNKRLWLITHVPLGVDVYSTLAEPQNSSGRITGDPVLFRVNVFNRKYIDLIRKYHKNIEVIFVGHTHMDWFQLYNDKKGEYIAFNHLSPAISPIYGNNPAYQVVTYDREKFKLLDYTVYYLNLDKANENPNQAQWEKEYTFTEVYDQPAYNLDSLVKVYKEMINDDSKAMKNYVKFYTVESTAQIYIDSHNWFNFYLAIGRLMKKEFMSEMNEEL